MKRQDLSRRQFIARSAVGVGGLTLSAILSDISLGSQDATSRPNIILILADDLGYDDLGVHGNKLLETPNLDAFAAQSVQFRRFIVAPVCAPTRAALLTGRQFLRTGVSHVHGGKDFVNTGETLIPHPVVAVPPHIAGYKGGSERLAGGHNHGGAVFCYVFNRVPHLS